MMAVQLTDPRTSEQTRFEDTLPSSVDVEVFFDGACPLCRREINLIRRMDRRQRIQFTDIAEPDFEPHQFGLAEKQMMDEIHGRLPDGEIITGVEVFRRLYSAVGLKWIVNVTRLPGISHVLDFGYRVFAKHRLRVTGRCDDGACQVSNH